VQFMYHHYLHREGTLDVMEYKVWGAIGLALALIGALAINSAAQVLALFAIGTGCLIVLAAFVGHLWNSE